MHTSRLRPKTPPETETPPEHMLCNECNVEGVSDSIQGYNDMSNKIVTSTCASINKTRIYLNRVYQISLELGKFSLGEIKASPLI